MQNLDIRGPLERFSGYGISGVRGEGNYAEIWLEVEDGKIARAAFRTPGCPSSTAVGSVLCGLITGREESRALALMEDDLTAAIGELPPGKGHYVGMMLSALRMAIEGGL